MRSASYRLIRALVVVGFLLLAARESLSDTHPLDTQASSHCDSHAASMVTVNGAGWNGWCVDTPGTFAVGGSCPGGVAEGYFACLKQFNQGAVTSCNNTGPFGGNSNHAYCEVDQCSAVAGEDIGFWCWAEGCDNINFFGCEVEHYGAMGCMDGDCCATARYTGEPSAPGHCPAGDDGDGDAEDGDGCTIEDGVFTCDCNANPTAWYCDENPPSNQCYTNPDGSISCFDSAPGNDPVADEGPPGSNQNPGTGDDDGGTDDSGGIGDHDDNEGGSATSSGDCSVAPVCLGDAIQCAMLTQQWRSICELADPDGNEPPWVDDPDYGRDLKAEAELISLSGQLDASGAGGGSCPENPTVDLLGQTVTLDLSLMCDVTGIIRVFVILAGWLTAAFICYRAIM